MLTNIDDNICKGQLIKVDQRLINVVRDFSEKETVNTLPDINSLIM